MYRHDIVVSEHLLNAAVNENLSSWDTWDIPDFRTKASHFENMQVIEEVSTYCEGVQGLLMLLIARQRHQASSFGFQITKRK